MMVAVEGVTETESQSVPPVAVYVPQRCALSPRVNLSILSCPIQHAGVRVVLSTED